jgi:SAM-dependent methyltransferase
VSLARAHRRAAAALRRAFPAASRPGGAPDVSPEPIVRVASGFMAAKQLFAAAELGLFAALTRGPLDRAHLASALGIPERSCRILADALVGLGLLVRDGEGYANGEAAAAYLAGADGRVDLRPLLGFWDAISYPHWRAYAFALRRGGPASLDLAGDRRSVFLAGVHAYNNVHAAVLAAHYDFGRHRRALDVGGLSIAFLARAVERHPRLRGTFFAEAATVDAAAAGLTPEGRTRIALVAGDPAADPLPGGHDLVLLEHVVHRHDPGRNRLLLSRARAAVEPGGRLLVLDFWLDEDVPERALDGLMAGEYLVVDGTVVYPEREVRAWVEGTGWRWLETRPLPGSPRLMVADAV